MENATDKVPQPMFYQRKMICKERNSIKNDTYSNSEISLSSTVPEKLQVPVSSPTSQQISYPMQENQCYENLYPNRKGEIKRAHLSQIGGEHCRTGLPYLGMICILA